MDADGGTVSDDWGPFHRHYGSDAIHRDGGPECDQPGSPHTVFCFDPDHLDEHDEAIRYGERTRLLRAASTLGKYVNADGYVPIGVVRALLGEKIDFVLKEST